MALVFFSAGLLLIALPGLLRRQARTLSPKEWTRLCLVALGGGALLIEISLVLLAVPTVLSTLGLDPQARVCKQLLESFAPMGGPAGWLLVTSAVFLPAGVIWGKHRASLAGQSMVLEPWVGTHRQVDGRDLVVIPCGDLVACSAKGESQQIVISQGLIDTLPGDELGAVIRHEATHLDHNHQRLLDIGTAVQGALGFLPGTRRSTRALRAGIERWADEEAAGPSPLQRAALHRALLRVAGGGLHKPSLAAFSGAESLLERLHALEGECRTAGVGYRLALYLPGASVATVVGSTLVHLGHAMGPYCLNLAGCSG